MAATLATGGVLSHATAAAAWELGPLGAGAIHVTVRRNWMQRAGVRVHRSRTLAPHDITTHRAIPITTPARAIIDLARTLKGRPPESALDRAEHLRLVEFAHRSMPPSLQAVLSLYTATTPTRRSRAGPRGSRGR